MLKLKRNYIAPRQETESYGASPKTATEWVSGILFSRSYLEAAPRNLPLDHTFLLICVLQQFCSIGEYKMISKPQLQHGDIG